ncbi:hypothetical protein PGB90_005157 [Kerria lacca]
MTALLTADWYPYGSNGYFRKVEIYEMAWQKEVNINNVVIVAARFGGPIAVVRDRTKPDKTVMKKMGKPIIAIYSSAGNLISSFVWNSGQLIHLGWSSTEELLCIQENGEVLIYSIFGKYVHAFRMGQEVEDTKVIEARVFDSSVGTGICVLTGAYRLFLTNTIKDPKVRKLAEIPGVISLPDSWAVICEDRQSFVLLFKATEIYYLSENQVIQKTVNSANEEKGSVITDVAVSSCYEHVAMYNSQDQLWIGSSNLRKNYRLYDMDGSGRPKQLVWCGSEAVVGVWDEHIIIIGRNEDSLSYVYDMPVKLIPEIDCVRVISTYNTEIIQPVPKVILETYRLNSTSPGSYLLEASKQFTKKNHRANEYIHLVKKELFSAINQCIEASSHELNTENQKMLIRAAQFGKTFAEGFTSENFVRMCMTLRILNAVRDPKIGIFLTFPQFVHLTLKNLLDRLILRRHYYLAIKAANYMRMSNEDGSMKILEHWAYYKVSQLEADKEQMAHNIANKLGQASGISYVSIAKKSASYGRIKLAVKLLDYEPKPELQVSMLLSLEKYTEALGKAVQSGNTDLINIVIVNMWKKMPLKDFQLEIRKDSVVYALYKKYCREHKKETLLNVYRQEDDNNEIAAYYIKNAFDAENYSMRTTLLENAKEYYKKAKNEINLVLCEEQKKLILKQKELEDKFKREFLDLPLQETIYRLLLMQENKIAEDLRSMFHVPDRKFWWLRIKSLGELNDFNELDKFSKIKKSPIGYEPFIDICLQHKNKFEANKYIGRIKEENKIKYLVKMSYYMEAIRIAEAQCDISALEYIRANCDTASVIEINSAIARLNKSDS